MFFKQEHVEQSHVANIMLLRYIKSFVLCYYTETTPLNPMRGNALKKYFAENFLLPTHAQFAQMGHMPSF